MRSGTFKTHYGALLLLSDNPVKWAWCLLGVALLVYLPFVANNYVLSMATTVSITAVAVMGLNILTGVTGLLSLGHAGFLALGAYTYAILTTDYQWHPLPAVAAGGALAAASSLIVGIPSLRLRGLYLALTTLGFAFIVTHLLVEFEDITRGPSGMPARAMTIFGPGVGPSLGIYIVSVVALLGAILASLNLMRSKFGRAWFAVHEHDIAASAMGINLTAYKLLAFVVSAFYAGVAGALFAAHTRYVNVDSFSILLSIEALAMLIVGGMGKVSGVLMGTAFLVLLPEAIRLGTGGTGSRFEALLSTNMYEFKEMLYGVVILLFLRFEPEGLAGIWRKLKRYFVLWPLSK